MRTDYYLHAVLASKIMLLIPGYLKKRNIGTVKFVYSETVVMKSRMKRAKGLMGRLVKSRKFKFKSLPRQPHLKLFLCLVCFTWIGIKNISNIWTYDTVVKHITSLNTESKSNWLGNAKYLTYLQKSRSYELYLTPYETDFMSTWKIALHIDLYFPQYSILHSTFFWRSKGLR